MSIWTLIEDRSTHIILALAVLLVGGGSVLDVRNGGQAWIILLLALGLLLTSADYFVDGAKALARKIGMSELIIGLTIVSIGTSLPEIMITGTAAFEAGSNPEAKSMLAFALGNIYGSVLVQITLILGIIVVVKPLDLEPGWLGRDGMIMFGSLILLTILIWFDNELSRPEGILLVSLYLVYLFYLGFITRRGSEKTATTEKVQDTEGDDAVPWDGFAVMLTMIVGLGCAVLASNHLVSSASSIAQSLGMPEAMIGVTIAAAGTSLPELAVGLAAVHRSAGVAIGTLLGSNITDPLLSIGIAAIIYPISLDPTVVTEANYHAIRLWIIPGALVSTIMALLFMWTSFRFQRGEGFALVAFYTVFTVGLLTKVYLFLPH